MAKTKSPAYQWYPKDIISSQRVALLTLTEEGAYRRALDFCWLHGSVPADPKKLSALIGKGCTPNHAKKIKEFFTLMDGFPDKMIHDRLEKERTKQKRFSKTQYQNGIKGGRPPKPKDNPTETQNKPTGYLSETRTKPLHITSAFTSADFNKAADLFLCDDIWIAETSKLYSLEIPDCKRWMEKFVRRLRQQEEWNDLKGLRKYFINVVAKKEENNTVQMKHSEPIKYDLDN